jgi:hypothetical protein
MSKRAFYVSSISYCSPTGFNSGLHIHIYIYIYIYIRGGEVCGRYVADARLIRESVTAPTSCGGVSLQTPQSVIILINGQLFSLGSRVLHLDTKPCSLGTTQTITSSLSHVFSSCSRVAKSNEPRSSGIDLIGVRDRHMHTPAPETWYSVFQGRRHHDGA